MTRYMLRCRNAPFRRTHLDVMTVAFRFVALDDLRDVVLTSECPNGFHLQVVEGGILRSSCWSPAIRFLNLLVGSVTLLVKRLA
jgi:hypothetical protein